MHSGIQHWGRGVRGWGGGESALPPLHPLLPLPRLLRRLRPPRQPGALQLAGHSSQVDIMIKINSFNQSIIQLMNQSYPQDPRSVTWPARLLCCEHYDRRRVWRVEVYACVQGQGKQAWIGQSIILLVQIHLVLFLVKLKPWLETVSDEAS